MEQQWKWMEGGGREKKKTAENAQPTPDANKRAGLYEEMNSSPEDVSRNMLLLLDG